MSSGGSIQGPLLREIERLRWERDLLALNLRGLPNLINLQVVYDQSGPTIAIQLLQGNATDDPVQLPKTAEAAGGRAPPLMAFE